MVASLAAELAPERIRANAVAPGSIDTDMTRACLPDDASLAATIRKIPLGTLGQPTDIAAACAFLCSEDAKYITGQTLVVDGGGWCADGDANRDFAVRIRSRRGDRAGVDSRE